MSSSQSRRQRAQPRTGVAPQMPGLDTPEGLLAAMMRVPHGDASEGCMETNWRGLPARELFLAAHKGQVERLESLLKDEQMRKRVNDFDNDKCQIIHIVGLAGQDHQADKIIPLLLKAGADVNSKSKSVQETALHTAVIYGKVNTVKTLLAHGARVDLTDWRGSSPSSRARKECSHNGASHRQCCQVLNLIVEAEQKSEAHTDRQNKANALRLKGNNFFVKKDYERARELYTQSIDVMEDHRAYANRALCSIEIGRRLIIEELGTMSPSNLKPYSIEIRRWGEDAMFDAIKSIKMDPKFVKAWYRCVIAKAMARDFPRAKIVCKDGLEECPGNKELLRLLKKLEAMGITESISPPYAKGPDYNEKVRNSDNVELCIYCTRLNLLPINEENVCIHCAMVWMPSDTDGSVCIAIENDLRSFILDE